MTSINKLVKQIRAARKVYDAAVASVTSASTSLSTAQSAQYMAATELSKLKQELLKIVDPGVAPNY